MESVKRIIILCAILLGGGVLVHSQRLPIIGISDFYRDGTNAAVSRSYVDAVLHNGGIPVVIPLMQDEDKLIELLNSLDGVIFTGGEDFDPVYYNEKPIPQMGKINAPRDAFDIRLLQLAAERSIPILGICRGVQLINIVFGGSLYQDLPSQYYDKHIKHRQTIPHGEASHSVIVEDQTVFADIVKERMLMVNSMHHQAIKKVAPGFRIAGKSPDQIVEVIEKVDEDHWIVGVQFHPELRVLKDNAMRRIFQRFIEEAGSLDKSDMSIKMASVTRKPKEKSSSEFLSEKESVSASKQPIIYRSVVDTQVIYKFITDTLYVYVPTDTVYISPPVAQSSVISDYIQQPIDTVHISLVDIKTGIADVNKPAPKLESGRITSDTMIYVPGSFPAKSPSDSFKPQKKIEKREKKEQARKDQEEIKARIKAAKEEQKVKKTAEENDKKNGRKTLKSEAKAQKKEQDKLKAKDKAKAEIEAKAAQALAKTKKSEAKEAKKKEKLKQKSKEVAKAEAKAETPNSPVDSTNVKSKKEKAILEKEAKKTKTRAKAIEEAKTKKEQEAAQLKTKLEKEAAKLKAKQEKENAKQEKKNAKKEKSAHQSPTNQGEDTGISPAF